MGSGAEGQVVEIKTDWEKAYQKMGLESEVSSQIKLFYQPVI
jgi:hypothetical protein